MFGVSGFLIFDSIMLARFGNNKAERTENDILFVITYDLSE
jgi:hypothetical protein